MDYRDPGWRDALREALRSINPLYGLTRGRRARVGATTSLEALRVTFIGLAVSLWLFLFVLSFLDPAPAPDRTQRNVNILVATVGVGLLAITSWLRARSLPSADAPSLLARYRGRFFILVGLSEGPALAGLAASFISGSLWTYAIGLALSTVAFFLIAPSRRNIEYEQEKLNAQGSPLSLGQLLTQPMR